MMSTTRFNVLMAALLVPAAAAVAVAQTGPAPQPLAQRAPDALERVTWRTRTLVGDDRLTRWKFAVPADGVGVPTFLEAVVRADAAIVDYVEGVSTQKVSADVQKNQRIADRSRQNVQKEPVLPVAARIVRPFAPRVGI